MEEQQQTTLEWVLLPNGMKFSMFEESTDGSYYPQMSHLLWALPIAFCLSLLRRYVVEGMIARKIGMRYGLKNKNEKPPVQHPLLLQEFKKSRRAVPEQRLPALMEATGMNEKQIQRWWRRMRQQGKPGLLTKFEEAFWRALFYTLSFIFGAIVVTKTPFFWDTELLWIKNPMHHVSDLFYWYYTVELGLYISLLVSQSTDVKRKDFVEMFVHHIVTISLIVMSWWANMVRIGTMVLLYHDVSDIFLEVAKLYNYLGWNDISFSIFAVFAVVFIISRLVLYPMHVVAGTFTVAPTFMDSDFPAANTFRLLLCALLILHLLWAKTIVNMVIDLVMGRLKGDQRSDDEEEEEDNEDENEGDAAPTTAKTTTTRSKKN